MPARRVTSLQSRLVRPPCWRPSVWTGRSWAGWWPGRRVGGWRGEGQDCKLETELLRSTERTC